MEIFIIVLLVLTGFILITLELLVIPGIAVAGVGGVVFMTAGIVYAYHALGATGGHVTLAGTLLGLLTTVFFAFRAKTWNRAMLHTDVDSHVDEIGLDEVQVGDEGKTVSRLAPLGKVKINGKMYEGKSISGYIDPGHRIEVVQLHKTNVTVKLINN